MNNHQNNRHRKLSLEQQTGNLSPNRHCEPSPEQQTTTETVAGATNTYHPIPTTNHHH
jgi:hypothetical protein